MKRKLIVPSSFEHLGSRSTLREMEGRLRPSGLPIVGDLSWGTHLCHFYRTAGDLVDCLVPYFRAGLDANELCLWVTAEPLPAAEAWASLRRVVPDLDAFLKRDQIEIVDFEDWYGPDGRDADAVIAAWRNREAEALARGFAGLRLTGNTFPVEKQDWEVFTDYEARVHESFRRRRILALCSYSLETCGVDELTEVIRNHKLALVRQSGRWEVAHSATVLIPALASGERAVRPRPRRHEVQFYEDGRFLAEKIAAYAAGGLLASEGVLLIGGEPRMGGVLESLAAQGIEPRTRLASGQLATLEARRTLARIMEGSRPERSRFEATIVPVVERLRSQYGSVRIYGEMVNDLLADGNAAGALELEGIWDGLVAAGSVSLLCGYDVGNFTDTDVLRGVSARHETMHPAEDLAELDEVKDPRRLLDELQQRSHLLRSERRARHELENERGELLAKERWMRAQAELTSAHLDRLQSVTASLSEAATPEDVARVINSSMAGAASAEQAILAVPAKNGTELNLLGEAAGLADAAGRKASLRADSPLPLAAAFRSGQPIWLGSREAIRECFPAITPEDLAAMACLPLVLGHKRLGAIAFGYRTARAFSPADRALLQDLAKQAGLALDRSLLLERTEQANQAKDEFLAMLGHELRNPLSPIVTTLQLMRLKGGEAAFGRELQVIERQVGSMVRLVDDLLDMSRITQGRVRLALERVETADVVHRALETARSLIEQHEHRLELAVASRDLPLEVDPGRIAQALSNLLINAAKYTDPGGRIAVEADADGEEVAIHVRDNGPGIPPELMPRLFHLFAQGRRAPDRRPGGLGIGLTVARSLIELHGGTIEAKSRPSVAGSEFIVRLPLRNSHPAPADDGQEVSAGRAVTPPSARVLIIDDNQDGADALAAGLEALGYAVRVAYDPTSGIDAARDFSPDVAVLDLGLPGMDGYRLGTRLKELPGLEAVRLVALTGYGQEVDRLRSRRAGFDSHLVKPAGIAQVDETLRGLSLRASVAALDERPGSNGDG